MVSPSMVLSFESRIRGCSIFAEQLAVVHVTIRSQIAC